MFVICVWVDKGDDRSFENAVPLQFLGDWLRKHHSQQEFHILFLYGQDRLSADYIARLKAVENFKVFDYAQAYTAIQGAFTPVKRFGTYETNCFLRWLVIEKHLRNHGITTQVWHMDGDILFNVLPETVASDTRGYTFTLQGCPGFVSIADHQWFEDYTRELQRFVNDIEGYSRQAWGERQGWEQTHQTRWAGNRFREIITSDQDFASHLIHTGRLLQDQPSRFVKDSRLYYAENPLYINSHAPLQVGKKEGLHFTVSNDTCAIEARPVALWHFQTNFVRYLNHQLTLKKWLYPLATPNELETSLPTRKMLQAISKYLPLSRLQVYKSIRELSGNTDGISFGEVFSKRRFWKKGVFE